MKKKKSKRPPGRPRGSVAETKKTVMTFRIATDVALFLEAARINGKNKTAMVENAIRQTYLNFGSKSNVK